MSTVQVAQWRYRGSSADGLDPPKGARCVWVDYEIADSDGGSGADSDSLWWRHPFTFTDSIFADAATSFERSVEGYERLCW